MSRFDPGSPVRILETGVVDTVRSYHPEFHAPVVLDNHPQPFYEWELEPVSRGAEDIEPEPDPVDGLSNEEVMHRLALQVNATRWCRANADKAAERELDGLVARALAVPIRSRQAPVAGGR